MLMIDVFRRVYTKLRENITVEPTIESSMFQSCSNQYIRRLIQWLLKVLENSSIDNDDLRVAVAMALRAFLVHMENDEVALLFEGRLQMLGMHTTDPVDIRRKISIYFLLASCQGMLKQQINY